MYICKNAFQPMRNLKFKIMNPTINNTGLIECGVSDQIFNLDHTSQLNGYSITKAYLKDKTSAGIVQMKCPKAEIVADKTAILEDKTIDFILVLSPKPDDMNFIGEALQAGKQVRIM
jgi:predicted dehydrogenase